MKTRHALLALFFCCCFAGIANSYLPMNWNEKYAREDSQKADAIIIGRAIEIKMIEEVMDEEKADGTKSKSLCRAYIASIRIGEVIKGNVKKGDVVTLCLGRRFRDNFKGDVNDLIPDNPLMMHNTQSGYDVQINNIYFMALSQHEDEKTKGKYWDLRSGPFSFGLVLRDNKIKIGKLGQRWSEEVNFTEYIAEIKKKLK